MGAPRGTLRCPAPRRQVVRPVLATTSSERKQRETYREAILDPLPRTWSKLEMKLLGYLADRVRSWVGAIWQVVAPHTGPGVVGRVVADIVRSHRELILENAMLGSLRARGSRRSSSRALLR
jgi:hypothetical protein